MSDLLTLSIFGELIPAANLQPPVSLTLVENQAGGGDGKSTTRVTAEIWRKMWQTAGFVDSGGAHRREFSQKFKIALRKLLQTRGKLFHKEPVVKNLVTLSL
jgi:hypothetical protein